MRTKRICHFLLVCLSIIFTWSICGAEENNKIGDVVVSPHMETIKEGDVNILVPKGGQLQKESSFLVMEGADEYASRRFSEMEELFIEIGAELKKQREELKSLREIMEGLKQEFAKENYKKEKSK